MFELFHQPLFLPALKAAIITGILLSYLGVHVVGRGIVFVDLALGQISSLGVAFAAFIGSGMTSIPLIFTLAGAVLMSFISIRDKRLKQEAIIGILYAFTSALTVMLISKTPNNDADMMGEVLFGSVFSITPDKLQVLAIVFASVAVLHIIFFRKFYSLTESFENGENHQVGIFNIWNFLFYISIGLSIVFAVKANGVIPVFSFLIIPAVSAIMLTKNRYLVIAFAIIISILGSYFGLTLALKKDFTGGPSIVAVLSGIFILTALYKLIRNLVVKKA
jgi:ABC-type Mn2+/Zn2+ transport system permease subunit